VGKLLAVTTIMFLAVFAMAFRSEAALTMDNVPRIGIDELKARLNDPNYIIIDVRTAHDWDDSDVKIKGAIREDSYKIGSWLSKYPKDKTLVFYCK